MITKAQEFFAIVAEKAVNKNMSFVEYLTEMPDVQWDIIMADIATNRLRDPNVGKFTIPKYNDFERLALTEFTWLNDKCGIHNSYWSRMWWMAKGGPLVKSFPPNAIMLEFEKRHGSN